jgi:hypothetical protein
MKDESFCLFCIVIDYIKFVYRYPGKPKIARKNCYLEQ